ncbi:hypothetical protein E4U57_005228 [Claviceps arundinis]|uniref:Uncharacterized protein n=1 Tax=Claviceps arundinis TaxID=1623583 RepID=A0A9P7MWZ7_9HYPO|nr:hypothetical protein E4U57_005228 [Claviceps arundinis]KAG5972951.1 hypothetical protein E4U56_005437 [Claviceps arundinis]
MATTQSATGQSLVRKLAPIPKGAHVQKRPLLRPQLSSSSRSPTMYMSSKTPFMSAVRRVRKQLNRSLRRPPASKNASLQSRVAALNRSTNTAAGATGEAAKPMVVTVMGTGKAIEKTLSLASWFEHQGDCDVALRTKTVKTVDDIVLEDGAEADESRVRNVSCLEVIVTLK